MVRKYISYIAAGMIFVAAGFLAGYFIGTMLYTEKSNAPVNEESEIIYNNYAGFTTPQIKTSEMSVYDVYYMLKVSEDRLCIYEVAGETSRLLRDFSININAYPEIDRRELCDGIVRNTLDEALETAENFTS